MTDKVVEALKNIYVFCVVIGVSSLAVDVS